MYSILPIIFLLGSVTISAVKMAMHRLGPTKCREELEHYPKYYGFYILIQKLFQREKWEYLYHFVSLTTHITRLCYGVSASFYLLSLNAVFSRGIGLFLSLVIIIFIALMCDFIFKLIALSFPLGTLKFFTSISTIYLVFFSPLTLLIMKIQRRFIYRLDSDTAPTKSQEIKRRLLELIHEEEFMSLLEPDDRKLLLSVASFKDRVAKEIMVPRIDVFSLSAKLTIEEAAKEFIEEGFSRIPVYEDNVDNIIGVLLYKDVIKYSIEANLNSSKEPLNAPIKDLISPVLYTPETKKISHLLQEFRSKKIHLSIVVDEYGGTEGIVTIEDILEELVGEISDEYDFDEECLYKSIKEGEWIVDAKMTTLDIEKELHITIPSSPEYETIGGFIYFRAGSIPKKGWCIYHDTFKLEVISSNERLVEKIKISPVASN